MNKLTTNTNLLWSSSRMIIPENRLSIIQVQDTAKKCSRPVLDDDQHEENIRILAVAMFTEKEAAVTVWSEYEDQTITGRITKLDKQQKRIRIENDDEYAWIDFTDVVRIELSI